MSLPFDVAGANSPISPLNDPDFVFDIDELDNDAPFASQLPVPTSVALGRSPQPQARIPTLDVSALVASTELKMEPGFSSSGMTTSPLTYSREVGPDTQQAQTGRGSSLVSSPHSASQSFATANAFSSIASPPLCARRLGFREFLGRKGVPSRTEKEESTGIFVGQLPSSYTEDDIEALLKAIGNETNEPVLVRDVKCHNRERTCAFVTVNASALPALLSFTKRILCDVNCVWVVEPQDAAKLPVFVQQMPRDQLRGVPKAALVLEKLTPQTKTRSGGHGGSIRTAGSPTALRFSGSQPNSMNIVAPNMPNMVPPPMFISAAAAPASAAPMPGFLDMSNPMAFPNGGFLPSTIGLPQFLGTTPFVPSNPPTPMFGQNSTTLPGHGPLFSPQMGGNIASIEAANQMLIAASRSGQNSNNVSMSTSMTFSPNRSGVIGLSATLFPDRCSCGQMLYLSQLPQMISCAKCSGKIDGNTLAYWCPGGHLAVCSACGMKSNGMMEQSN